MDAQHLTVNMLDAIQVGYAAILFLFGVIGWFIRGMVSRLEKEVEQNNKMIEKLREEMHNHHTDTVDTYGKFGARLANLEGQLAARDR